jgi:hypothetical protein
MIKPRFAYANVAATLALVFSMTGGAMAAHHYLITSTKQISPKVVKALQGKTGKTGPTGKEGPAGKEGTSGKDGAPGIGPAFGAFRDESVEITSTSKVAPTVIATLTGLPAGAYAIQAKTVVDDENASEDLLTCTLTAGGDFDIDELWMSRGQIGDVFRSVFALQVLHTFSATGGSAQVTCFASVNKTSLTADHTKITAVQVSSIANKGVGG